MGSSRSFGSEKTRGKSSLRKGPMGDVVLDIYADVDDGFNKIEAEVDAISSAAGALTADTLTEKTADNGVSVEGVTLKDGNISLAGAATVQGTDIVGNDNLRLRTVGNEHISLMPAGNGMVGVNKATPTVMLDVDGAVTSTANVTGLGFSDTGRGYTAQKTADSTTINVAAPAANGVISLSGSERAGQITVTLETTDVDNSNPLQLALSGGGLSATDVPMVTVCGTDDAGQLNVSSFISESGPTLNIDIRQFSGSYDISAGTNATLKVNWVLL